jgi:hypothetical protein
MSVHSMHSGAMALSQLDAHESHQLLFMHRKRDNVLSTRSLACQNVCKSEDMEILRWALRMVHGNNHWRVFAAAEGKA